MKYILQIILLGFFAMACDNSSNISKDVILQKKEMIISDTSDSWGGDAKLSIIKIQKQNNKKIFTVISSFNGADIGFELSTYPVSNKNNGFHSTGITIKSLGGVSDKLLHSLAKIYSVKIDSTIEFIDSINATYVNLDEMAESMGSTEKTKDVDTKLFLGNPDVENDYGELYLDFNEEEGWVELKEKDIEYRPQVIKALSKK